MLSIGQICKENFHPFGDARDDVINVWMFATSKAVNQLHQNFCDLTEYIIYILGYNKLRSNFVYAAKKAKLLYGRLRECHNKIT